LLTRRWPAAAAAVTVSDAINYLLASKITASSGKDPPINANRESLFAIAFGSKAEGEISESGK
jgi:hypothetical protein